jgi:nucleotide-binding universal stress UspA family protein
VPTRRIVLGLDGTPGSAAATAWCAAMAPVLDAEVLVVNAMTPVSALVPSPSPVDIPPIIDDTAIEESVHHELESELETWCTPLREAGVAYRSHVVDGSVIDALLSVADEVDADLIVVGRQKHGGLREKLLGSVPDHLSHACSRPVVIVPPS